MPTSFLLTAVRNLSRNKLQSFINIISLALGLAVFAFAFLYVKQQLSYNTGWPDAERIHRLVLERRGLPGATDGEFTSVGARAWPLITDYFAGDLEAATRVSIATAGVRESDSLNLTRLTFVDPAFSNLFPLDVIAGNLERALSGPGFVALEETYAASLGLDIEPGSRVTLVGSQDDELEFEVAAIYRLQPNRSQALDFGMVTLIHDYSLPLIGTQRQFAGWENAVQIWLKLKPGIETAAFNARQPAFVQTALAVFYETLGPDQRISDHLFYRWQPLRDIYFNPVGIETRFQSGDLARVITFAVVGILVLLVGCSNSVSLSLASASERRREVGIRKAVGALRQDIIVHALGESALLALAALIPALVLLELLLPTFQTLMPFRVVLKTGWVEYGLLTLIAVLVGLCIGIYPALVLSDVRPQAVLKIGAGSSVNAGQRVRALLVGAQFCLASMLLIATAALYLQLAVTRSQPLGFNPANLVFVWFGNNAQGVNVAEPLHQELGKIPGILQVAQAINTPNENITGNDATLINKNGSGEEIKARNVLTSHGFLDLVQVPLLAGRGYDLVQDWIDPQATQDEQPRVTNLIVNRRTTEVLGFASPDDAVGQLIDQRSSDNRGQFSDTPTRIIGVVEDNMYDSLRRRPGPEIYRLMPAAFASMFMLKYEPTAEITLQEKINEVALRVTDAPALELVFIEPHIDAAFRQEQNESKLLLISGALALLLACIGLYGLAAFLMESGIKEVGVRKVLGADVGSIVVLFMWRFAWPVLIANLIAWPMAVHFALQWIERFPYQIDKVWLLPLCLGTAGVVLLIALLTTGVIIVRAASTRPVSSLRYE